MAIAKRGDVPTNVAVQLPHGFIASAAHLPPVRVGQAGTTQGWQEAAWRYYDTLGEVRYIANWVGNMMSRAELKVVKKNGPEYTFVENGPAKDAMDAFFGGKNGQSEMLQQTGINLNVSGEAYHAVYGRDEQWLVLGTGAVRMQNKKAMVKVGTDVIDPAFVYRVWTPHPRRLDDADSPLRSNMGVLSELEQLNLHVLAQLDSRLIGAGILFVPSEMQFTPPEGADPASNSADLLLQTLGEVMATGRKDRGSAAAHVPVVVSAPGEVLDKIQHITFWTPLDAASTNMRDNALQRLAVGMDTPPEILLGMGNSNHWSSWLVDEVSIKSHLEPRLQVVVNAVTTAYLRPAIEDVVPDPENYSVVADTSMIRLRPNRTTEAIELYDRGELKGDSLRRETGFGEMDKPDGAEFQKWLLKKIATGSSAGEQTIAALKELGVDLVIEEPEQRSIEPPKPKQPADDMRIDSHTRRRDQRKPDMKRSVSEKEQRDQEIPSGIAAASEMLVLRALERAGNRLCDAKARAEGLGKVQAHERYLKASGNPDSLLEGAWDFADVLLMDVEEKDRVVLCLDNFTRGLLINQIEYDRNSLRAAIQQFLEV